MVINLKSLLVRNNYQTPVHTKSGVYKLTCGNLRDVLIETEIVETPEENSADSVDAASFNKECDFYKTNHCRRGVALIFNHYTFDDRSLNQRDGTKEDGKNISETLTQLGFDVREYVDPKFGKIYDILNDVAAEDHTDNDCLVVVAMSHGDTGVIHAKDTYYSPETLWKPFSVKNCNTLAGKPKLFFIQACRGEKLDAGVEVTECDSVYISTSYAIPTMPEDCLVMYSTTQDHYSFRSPTNGSWFIQCLCKELNDRAKKQDLLTILTFVNRAMAFDFKSNTPGNWTFHEKKQIGSIVSGLTKWMYFYKTN